MQGASNKHEEFYKEFTSGVEGTMMCFSPLLLLSLRVLRGYWFNLTAILSSSVNYLQFWGAQDHSRIQE